MSGTTEPNAFDLPLIKTLGKAFYWQRLIDTGEAFDVMTHRNLHRLSR